MVNQKKIHRKNMKTRIGERSNAADPPQDNFSVPQDKAFEALLQSTADSSMNVRVTAVKSIPSVFPHLTKENQERAFEALLQSTADSSMNVRAYAAKSIVSVFPNLTKENKERALEALHRLTRDSSRNVRALAVQLISEIPSGIENSSKTVKKQEGDTRPKQKKVTKALPKPSKEKHALTGERKKDDLTRDLPYDVALSFASEQREYVERVAENLKKNGIKVFYDKDYEVDMWGKDLSEYFMSIFYQKSRYCIMFISKDYVSKAWPTHERKVAIAKQIEKMGDYILPVRFDESVVPGLPTSIGYEDATKKTPEDIANLFLKKLKLVK